MFKSEMFFSMEVGQRGFGWSEGHFDNASADLPTALSKLIFLSQARVPLLGAGVLCSYLRVSDPDEKGDSQVAGVRPPALAIATAAGPVYSIIPNIGTSQGDTLYDRRVFDAAVGNGQKGDMWADFPYSAMLFRCEGPSPFKARSQMFLRGQPDLVQDTEILDPAGQGPAGAVFTNLLGAYLNRLQTLYGFRSLDPNQVDDPITQIANTSIVPGQLGNVQLTALAHGLAIGDKVRVGKVKFSGVAGGTIDGGLNGVWKVFAVPSANIVQIAGQFRYPGPDFLYTQKGTITKQVYQYSPYANIIFREWAKKNTGGPFDRPSGKAKVRA